MLGYQLGRLIGFFLVPLLLLGAIALIQYWRTRDSQAAMRSMVSWWAIGLALACLLLGIVGQAVR
jgi:hypothetical protein